MKLQNVKINIMLALAIVFAICYQSLHIFIDSEHHHHAQKTKHTNCKSEFSATEKEECLVCDFEFAAYLCSEINVLDLFSPKNKYYFSNTYKSLVSQNDFCCYSLRGPPLV